MMKALLGVWGLSFLLFSCLPFPAWGTTGTLTITADTTLTEDHTGGIVIGADNITLNCDNHTVTGPGGNGISIGSLHVFRSGVTVKNCHVSNFLASGFIIRAGGTTLTGNTATGNREHGFGFFESHGTYTGNTAAGNGFDGFHFDLSSGTMKENTATGNGGSGFNFESTRRATLKENTATDNGSGFVLSSADQNTLTENTADNNGGNGFSLHHSKGNTLKENAACDNQDFDAFQDGTSTDNVFKENDFCTTSGI
jgi:parallel beta-helix repeat protein